MAKPWAKAFYDSKAWERCRDSYIADRVLADGGYCERCREELGFIVHHVTELTPENIRDPLVSLNHANLQYLCKKCHDKVHGVFCESERSYYFDDNGEVLPIPPGKKSQALQQTTEGAR